MNPRLCVEKLTKTFPDHARPVIEDVSFCVHPGEVFALVGPSGCGKTTTLRTIMGFERADRGRVLHDEKLLQDDDRSFVPPEQRGIGFVFQDYALFPHKSVIKNVMFGLRKLPRRRRRQVARECLWMVGLMGMEDKRPQELSGGQQQRVAIARAIAPGSRIILLDEPFSNLDPDLRHATRNEMRMLAHRAQLGVVLVTHDQEEALSTADRLAVMEEGRLKQIATPEQVYNRPADAFVAQFLGRTNLLRAIAHGDRADTSLGSVPLDRDAAGEVLISLRPEHLTVKAVAHGQPAAESTNGEGPAVGQIISREFKGHDMTYRVQLNRAEYVVQTDFRQDLQVGQTVRLEATSRAAVIDSNALPQLTHEQRPIDGA
jgi:iron(III) transport system ATP-binding protein